ncbi:hypothetical protein NSK_005920 [Nannochloropsis salina CCMP1776]|uniref:Uncharacterized protein n=1 Tax=Nannochloropsis salina CCMP1776 TaxID=1027361 RepID=A0A4D9CX37_9STRA|nr:hypothetical protein NSK_005920 [Nannochloropsis salina CCMP1776]|eukprot:TFJ82727.1 hypothetical protein NSK_005920 [Nannochloropsis salina CCMP1776]
MVMDHDFRCAMVLCAVLITPYLIFKHEATPLLLQWSIFSVASVLLETQIYAFRDPGLEELTEEEEEEEEEGGGQVEMEEGGKVADGIRAGDSNQKDNLTRVPSPSSPVSASSSPVPLPPLILLAVFLLLLTLLLIVALYFLFQALDRSSVGRSFITVIGSGGSSLLLALGFLPQLHLMWREKKSAGFSLGLSLLDLLGCSLSILVLCLEARQGAAEGGWEGKVEVGRVFPYAIIVAFQVLGEGGREGGREGRSGREEWP